MHPEPQNRTELEIESLQVKMRSYWRRAASKSHGRRPYKKRRGLTETSMGRRLIYDRGTNQTGADTSQGTCQQVPSLASNQQRLGEWHETDGALQLPEGTDPANTLISDFLTPKL